MTGVQKYLALVRLMPGEGRFVIRSPDFPELEEQCSDFDRIAEAATEAVRAELGKLEGQGKPLPDPTPKEALETRPEYRECFLIPVEVVDDGGPMDAA